MSWHFSRALVAESSAASCWAGAAFVPSKLRRTVVKSSCKGKTTDAYSHSPSGMTCEPLTASRGVGQWISSLADSHAKIFPPLAKARESKASGAGYGERWRESLAKYDHASRSWKTRQCSLLGGLTEFSETWPRWGMMRDGALFPLPTLALHTCERESGFLPTIGKNEYRGTSKKRYLGSPHFRGAKMAEGLRTSVGCGMYLDPGFAENVMMWPIMWSALQPLAMDRCHSARQSPSKYFMGWLDCHRRLLDTALHGSSQQK